MESGIANKKLFQYFDFVKLWLCIKVSTFTQKGLESLRKFTLGRPFFPFSFGEATKEEDCPAKIASILERFFSKRTDKLFSAVRKGNFTAKLLKYL